MQNIMQMLSVFAGVSITIGIIIIILANAVSDCTTLPDYNSTAGATQTGWAAQCESNNTQTQNAMTLLIVVEVVIAAVIIIGVVKLI